MRAPLPLAPAAWSAAMLAAWTAIGALGRAQDEPDLAAVMLARTCVSEAGWEPGADCPAIYAVAVRRARVTGSTLAAALAALSPRLHGDGPLRSRSWLRGLDATLGRPPGLGAPWERPRAGGLPSRRDAWASVLDVARGLVTGEGPAPCSAEPHAWGSDADVRRRCLAGYAWTDVDCGETRNRFGSLRRVGP